MPKVSARGGYALKASPFFRLRSRKKLAELLQVAPNTLKAISQDNGLYVRKWKHKESDNWLRSKPASTIASSYRPIDIPDPRLKALQSRIAALLGRVTPPDFLFSPVKGRSYVDNATLHIGAKAFWLLDVADYFPSCTANNVAHFFKCHLECSPDVTAVLVALTTWNGHLPQGSPCSPILAYFSNLSLWNEVARLVQESGCKMSLYADDISISGSIIRKSLIWRVKKIVHRHGLKLKPSKEVSLIAKPAEITGVIVRESDTRLPNRKLKLLTELKIERNKTHNPKLREKFDNQIAGRRAQRKQVEKR